MKKLILSIHAALWFLIPGMGWANEGEEYARTGWYIGAAAVLAVENFRNQGGLVFDDSSGFSLRGGYRLDRLIALEVEMERNQNFALHGFSGEGLATWAGSLNAKVFPFQGSIQPYGILGSGILRAEASGSRLNVADTGTFYRGGAGLDWYMTPQWVVNLEATYVFPRLEVEDLDYLSLNAGVLFRF